MNNGNTIGKSIGARIIAIMVQIAKIAPITKANAPGIDKLINIATQKITIDAIATKIPAAPVIPPKNNRCQK